jgi:hypothetical protein
LQAICFLIDRAIGHGDAKSDLEYLLRLCQQLGYGESEVKALLAEAEAEYSRDRGKSLLERAFTDSPT